MGEEEEGEEEGIEEEEEWVGCGVTGAHGRMLRG